MKQTKTPCYLHINGLVIEAGDVVFTEKFNPPCVYETAAGAVERVVNIVPYEQVIELSVEAHHPPFWGECLVEYQFLMYAGRIVETDKDHFQQRLKINVWPVTDA